MRLVRERKARRTWSIVTALVAMLLLVASACGGDDDEPDASGAVTEEQPGQEESPEQDEPSEQDESPEQEEPTQGGTLRFGIVGGGSESLDPHTWVASHDIVRASLVYETLTELDENGNPVMLLASDMQPNADASVAGSADRGSEAHSSVAGRPWDGDSPQRPRASGTNRSPTPYHRLR